VKTKGLHFISMFIINDQTAEREKERGRGTKNKQIN